jgi:hypothetical protein
MLVSFGLVVVPLVMDPKIDYFIVLGFWATGIALYYPFVYKKWRLPYMGKLHSYYCSSSLFEDLLLTESKKLITIYVSDQITLFIQCVTLAAPSPYKQD